MVEEVLGLFLLKYISMGRWDLDRDCLVIMGFGGPLHPTSDDFLWGSLSNPGVLDPIAYPDCSRLSPGNSSCHSRSWAMFVGCLVSKFVGSSFFPIPYCESSAFQISPPFGLDTWLVLHLVGLGVRLVDLLRRRGD